MAMTFDATLKEMGRDCPQGFLAVFDRPPTLPLRLLNVDLSTVTAAADLVVGLGEPLKEIVHLEFQSAAAAWKHADLLVYNALLYANYHVPVHTVVVLLRPEAGHSNMNGVVDYAGRPGRGMMHFGYELVRLWEERTADELLSGDVGVTPLAVLGRLPDKVSLEEGLAAVAQRVVERLTKEAPERATKLLTEALLLTGLRVRRDAAVKIFRGVRMMQESDTYLMILDEGQEKFAREIILAQGEDRFGPSDENVKASIDNITDLARLKRMARQTPKAASWQEILDTP